MSEIVLVTAGDLLTYTLNGLSRGMLIFLIASGLTLIFGLIGLINFAHGALMTLGAYGTMVLAGATGNFWVGLAASVLLVAVLGYALERTILHRLYDQLLLGFLATFGIALVIREALSLYFGSQSYRVGAPFPGSVEFLGIVYPKHRLLVTAIGAVIAVVIGALLTRTRLGKEIHATAYDPSTAEMLGINSVRLYTITFVLGVALAALAGGLTAPITSVHPELGLNYLLTAFLVVIVGGMGSFKGSFVASLAVGQIIAFGWLVVRPTYVLIFIFLAAMVFVVFKPRGLFGKKEVFS